MNTKQQLSLPIYFDNSATTKVDDRVLEAMLPYLKGDFGNPASRSHSFGWSAEKAVELARQQVAQTVGCDPKEVIWTSGATESINLALKGVASFYQDKGKHIITFQTEHKATLDSMRELERLGFEVSYLPVKNNGLIDLDVLKESIRSDTILLSVMLVNNEIGVIQDIKAISEICKKFDVIVHVDAAQAVGKMIVDFADLNIDLMSLSAHKVYGPKGIGALCVRRKPRIRLHPLIHGGGHERGYRSGTLPTHQIVGMGAAFQLSQELYPTELPRIISLRDRLLSGLQVIEEMYINGDMEHRVPHNLNLSFNYVEGESLIMAIKSVAVSSGSACTSASLEPSYVLRAIGRNDELAHSSIRFSIGRFNTEAEVDFVIELLVNKIAKLRDISPLWEMYKQGVDISNYKWEHHEEQRDIVLYD
jgi:cysteine desulfurase